MLRMLVVLEVLVVFDSFGLTHRLLCGGLGPLRSRFGLTHRLFGSLLGLAGSLISRGLGLIGPVLIIRSAYIVR